jgi:hypothetical protein
MMQKRNLSYTVTCWEETEDQHVTPYLQNTDKSFSIIGRKDKSGGQSVYGQAALVKQWSG